MNNGTLCVLNGEEETLAMVAGSLVRPVTRAETARLRVALLRLGRQLRKRGDSGLTPSQASALSVLERHGTVRLGELARMEQIGKSAVTRMVSTLEREGLLASRVNEDDRRSTVVELTEPGRLLLNEAHDRSDEHLTEQLARLDEGERELLRAALPVLERLVVGRR
jgi:DNA-binding MarR family transcriptional regulator